MATAYIISDYGKLGKHDDVLVFTQPDGERTVLYPYKTDRLVLMGRVSISADALWLLSRHKIPTTLISNRGEFNGKIDFGDGKNVFLRQKQYRLLDDTKASLEIARSIVVGKIRNSLSFVQRIKRKNDSDDERVAVAIEAMKNAMNDADKTDDIEKLRGYEGSAARAYFSVFAMNILPEWASFPKRSRNPPETNVNAVLSFLYTLLSYRVDGAIEAHGMDSYCGNLHALDYGSTSLVFDLMEEFRVAVCDTVCCSLFNLGMLKEDDFESENEIGVYMKKAALKTVIAAFEEKMDSEILYAHSRERMPYKKIIHEQAHLYKRVLLGEEATYKPFLFK